MVQDLFPSIDLAYFIIITALLAATLAYSIYQNWNYVTALGQIVQRNSFSYTPIDLGGFLQAVLAAIQVLLLGTLISRTILLGVSDRFFLKIASFGFGFGVTGLVVTILSDVQSLYFWPMEGILLALIGAILVVQWYRLREYFLHWLRSLLAVWEIKLPAFTIYERAVIIIVGILAFFVYYDAIMFPIVETDAIIYHASAAAIAFYNHGMPLIDGGGVGLGTSSNYPLLFSYLGTYFYLFAGGVHDVYLRAITSTMWLLSLLTTYLAGEKIGGRRIGMLAMFLLAMVPSYISYAFQTTQETTETFFLALGFLFLIYALSEDSKTAYYLGCGISFGAACLTSYQALFFLFPLGLVLGIKFWQSEARRILGVNFLWLLISLVAIGSTPYVRNLVLLHNPVFPFFNNIFQSPNLSPSLFAMTLDALRYTAYSFVNPSNPTFTGFLLQLISYQSFYPLNSTLIIPSLLLLPVLAMRGKLTLALFIIVPSAVIFSFPAPSVRYFWLILPFAAIVVARMLLSSREALRLHRFASSNFRIVRVARFALPILLLTMLVFPIFVLLGVQNYTFIPLGNSPTNNYLGFFTNPGIPASTMLAQIYGTDVGAWNWLNTHLTSGGVATFETRTYYLNFALRSPSSMFYLDGSYALPLYSMDYLPTILSFMRNESIRYIFIRAQDWGYNLFSLLPFTQLLGSPYLPLMYANGQSQIFQVGPKNDVLVNGTNTAYAYGLSSSFIVRGRIAENVTTGDVSPFLSLETDNTLTVVNIQYLDVGTGSLSVNVYNPAAKSWLYSYVTIQKHGSNGWLDYSFPVPMNLLHPYTQLGLYASQSNFTISKITSSTPIIDGRTAYSFAGQLQTTNQTSPSSIMIYLPILNPGDHISVQTMAHNYNLSLTIYSGFIALNQTSGWQLNHQLILSSLASGGIQNPSLQWSVKDSGIYTLVLTLTDVIANNAGIDVSIIIGATS